MRPLETEYKGWTIRVITRSTGRAWSALVEVWAPGKSGDKAAEPVPYNATSQNEQVVDPHPEVLVEVAGTIVPPRVAAGLRVMEPVRVEETPAAEPRERRALGRRDVRPAVAGRGVPDVGVLRGDVEVAADDQRLRRMTRLAEPAREPLVPHELGRVERRADHAAVGRVDRHDAHRS